MDTQDYNKAENAVDKVKWTVHDYAEKAKDYIREQRDKNLQPTAEGWFERAKANVSEAWEHTKDAASDAWEKAKDTANEAAQNIKDATDGNPNT